MGDAINHPAHYTFGRFEVIEVIEAGDLGFNLGNAVKSIARAGRKGPAREDLEKARWYLSREIDRADRTGLDGLLAQAEGTERGLPPHIVVAAVQVSAAPMSATA